MLRKVSLICVAVLAAATPAVAGDKQFSVLGGMIGSDPMPRPVAPVAPSSDPMTTGAITAAPPVVSSLAPTRNEIDFKSTLPPGSILVRTAERKLYFIEEGGKAISYVVAVGREGFAWKGTNTISRKAEWPDWHTPAAMVKREAAHGHIIPDFMKGGENNPLGARALYLGQTDYRIHGTNQLWSVGYASSSGCIRMRNDDVIELYNLVKTGAKVVVE